MQHRFAAIAMAAGLVGTFAVQSHAASTINLVYTSDPHYAITRARFHQASKVNAQTVNRAMIRQINALSAKTAPADSGVLAKGVIGPIDYLVETGDIANRMDSSKSYQSDSASWSQFWSDYNDSLTLSGRAGTKPSFLLSPGNHDVTNAIGYYAKMIPDTDPTSMVEIYNRMLQPTVPKTNATYNYATDKVNYSRDIGGVHFMFVNIWPDSANRAWMESDLASVPASTPVLLFTHDQPSVEAKHLTNPNGAGTINATDKFENLLEEHLKDGAKTIDEEATIEMRGFAAFLKAHKNIRAYFHGNENANEFYVWKGPDNDVALPTFRVDSPMKGNVSAIDETKLSFQLISIDSASLVMTVREVRWNPDSTKFATSTWGESKTMSLKVVPSNDSLLSLASSLVDSNYTIPSWTLLLRAKTKLARTGSVDAAKDLQEAISRLQAKSSPFAVVASFHGDPASRMAFNWLTNANVSGQKLQLLAAKTTDTNCINGSGKLIEASTEPWNDVNYNVSSNGLSLLAGIPNNSKRSYSVNKVLAKDLKANTTYSYRVGKAGAWSAIGHFTTARCDKSPFSFLYFTDPQANNDEMFSISSKTLHAATSTYKNARFILSSGDLVETSGSTNSEWEYEQFFRTQQDIWNEFPFVPVIGNHDKSLNKNFSKHFNTATPSFDSAMSTTPGSIYSFVYGDALFMAFSYEDYSKPGVLDSLKGWMGRQILANPNTKWRIAYFHKTMYTGSQSHQSDADGRIVRDSMAPLFDSLHIDLALQGHDHIYEVMGPIKNKSLVAGAVTAQTSVATDPRANLTGKLGGTFDVNNGTLYFLNNSAGRKKYEPRDKIAMDTLEAKLGMTNYFSLFTGRFGQTGEPTFSEIHVSTDSIGIQTYTVDDAGVATLFDAFKVVKGGMSTIGSSTFHAPPLRAAFAANGRKVLVEGNIEGTDLAVDVLDLRGNRIASQNTKSSGMSIALPHIANGIYLVKVRSGSLARTYTLFKN
ncbi:MAG: metallophosphoesterase [Fibrobacteres bacterium]|jgi:hypothetical protein|nr:metallophosphoesterase [Fibrobacterota bacterium]